MRSLLLVVPALAIAACAAPAETSIDASRDEVTTAPDLARVVECEEASSLPFNPSTITFLSTPGEEGIVKAVYRPSGSTPEGSVELNVCTRLSRPGPPFLDDERFPSYRCNDVTWVDGHAVELLEGGPNVAPGVVLSKMNGSGPLEQVDTKYTCHYANDPTATLPAGAECRGDVCGEGLACCYPCGIAGCINRCMALTTSGPFAGSCPAFP